HRVRPENPIHQKFTIVGGARPLPQTPWQPERLPYNLMSVVVSFESRTGLSLLVNCFRLGFGEELLKAGIIPDRGPNGTNLQAGDRNVFPRGHCEQLPKVFYRLFRLASMRFDLGQSDKES